MGLCSEQVVPAFLVMLDEWGMNSGDGTIVPRYL